MRIDKEIQPALLKCKHNPPAKAALWIKVIKTSSSFKSILLYWCWNPLRSLPDAAANMANPDPPKSAPPAPPATATATRARDAPLRALTKQPRRARGRRISRHRARGNGGGGGARATRGACCGKPRPARPGGHLPQRAVPGVVPGSSQRAVAVRTRPSLLFQRFAGDLSGTF